MTFLFSMYKLVTASQEDNMREARLKHDNCLLVSCTMGFGLVVSSGQKTQWKQINLMLIINNFVSVCWLCEAALLRKTKLISCSGLLKKRGGAILPLLSLAYQNIMG